MGLNILDCELLNVAGRVYRVIGSAAQSSGPVRDRRPERAAPAQAIDEDLDEDEMSQFEIEHDGNQFKIRLAYDAEVR